MLRRIIYKIFLVLWTFATIGKWCAVVMLVLNVAEAIEKMQRNMKCIQMQ